MSGRTVGYARIVAGEEPRVTAVLRAAGCTEVHLERVTGTRAARQVWTDVRAQLHRGDTLMVVTLTDVNWALSPLVQMLADLQRGGVRFRSIAESIDSAHVGYADVVEALSRFPGQVIEVRDQVLHNASLTRARGRRGGRPATLNPDQTAEAQRLYDQGELTVDAIASQFSVSRSTLYRHLRRPASTTAHTPKEMK